VIISSQKESIEEQMQLYVEENNVLQVRISELEHQLEIRMLQVSDSKSYSKSVLNASHADLKDLYLKIETFEKAKINMEI
jgi:regulator of replication initiation timing